MIHRPGSRSVTAKVCTIVMDLSDTPHQSITEVARRIGLPVSTTHRLLYELVEGGLVERSPDGRFTVRVELQPVLGPERRAAQARAVVWTALEDRAAGTGLRARFGVWHPDGISYLERAPDILPGSCVAGLQLLPFHATASGKAMLAHAPPWVVACVVKRGLPAYTPVTLAAADQLHRDPLRTRTSGFATSRRDWRGSCPASVAGRPHRRHARPVPARGGRMIVDRPPVQLMTDILALATR